MAIDWYESRVGWWEFFKVDFATWSESSRIENVTGGTVEQSALTDLKVTGSLDFYGNLDIGSNLVRCYYVAQQGADTVRTPIATLFAETSSGTIDYTTDSGSADLYSTLRVLSTRYFRNTYTVAAASNAINAAAALCTACGLQVIATGSDKVLSQDAVFVAGEDTYLDAVNYLCDIANFNSVNVDGYGRAVLTAYESPNGKTPQMTLADDADSIFEPEIDYEYDTFDVPNVIVCTCSNSTDEVLTAYAENVDVRSPFSIQSRGYEITRCESYSDITTVAELQAKADALLDEASTNVETVTLSHFYVPFSIGDVLRVNYTSASFDYTGSVVSRDIDMTPAAKCKTKLRRFVVNA